MWHKCYQGYERTKTCLEPRLWPRQQTAAWTQLRMTRAASSKPKNTSWSGRGMHQSAIMENIFNDKLLWHHASLIFGPPVHSRFFFPNFPCSNVPFPFSMCRKRVSHWCSLFVKQQLLRALAVDTNMAEWTEQSNKKSPLANPWHDGTSWVG